MPSLNDSVQRDVITEWIDSWGCNHWMTQIMRMQSLNDSTHGDAITEWLESWGCNHWMTRLIGTQSLNDSAHWMQSLNDSTHRDSVTEWFGSLGWNHWMTRLMGMQSLPTSGYQARDRRLQYHCPYTINHRILTVRLTITIITNSIRQICVTIGCGSETTCEYFFRLVLSSNRIKFDTAKTALLDYFCYWIQT